MNAEAGVRSRACPEAVSSWVHVDFIRGLLPSEAQKIGGEGALAKVKADYQSQEPRKESRVTRS